MVVARRSKASSAGDAQGDQLQVSAVVGSLKEHPTPYVRDSSTGTYGVQYRGWTYNVRPLYRNSTVVSYTYPVRTNLVELHVAVHIINSTQIGNLRPRTPFKPLIYHKISCTNIVKYYKGRNVSHVELTLTVYYHRLNTIPLRRMSTHTEPLARRTKNTTSETC